MLTQEQLIAYLENTLSSEEREQVETLLANDPADRRQLADQQRMDQALRVVLGSRVAHERVKQSILTVLRGASLEQLKAQVMEATLPGTRYASPLSPAGREGQGKGAWFTGKTPFLRWWEALALWSGQWSMALRAAALVIVVGVTLFLCSPGPLPPPIAVGQFAAVVGQPRVQHNGQPLTLNSQLSTPIYLGDRIQTGDADKAEIRFNDGTTLRLNFNTTIEVPSSEFRVPSSRTVARPKEIKLLLGHVWAKVQKTTTAPQFAVHTPVATAAVKGTEFGLKLQKANPAQLGTRNRELETNFVATLTVKEGAVEFSNPLGVVQATAMTESTARTDAPPTEPKRLQTLQVVRLPDSREWFITTSALDWPEAAERLATGGGWTGLRARDFPLGAPATTTALAPATNEVRVIQVSRQSPADAAGLKLGDILVAINGQPIVAANQINQAFLLRSDSSTTLAARRAGEERLVTLTATNRPSILPGPALTVAQQASLADVTRQLVTPTFQSANPRADNSPIENRRNDFARRLTGSNPLRAAAQNNLGVIFELEDAMGPAIRAYGQATYIAPDVALYHFNLGLALRKIGSFDRAAEELAAASRLAPQFIEARKRLAEIHSLLSDDIEALAQVDAALRVAPQDHGLWELKALILTKQNRAAEASDAARKAVETGPGCPVALGYLAGALEHQEKFVEAEQTYQQALELAPFNAVLHMNLGLVLNARGQFLAAVQSLRKAIELQPDLVLAHRNLGSLLGARRQWADAEAALEKAAKLDPDDVAVIRDLGELALKQGRFDQAEMHFQKALQISPNDAESYFGLGEVRRERRQFAQAEQMYRKAIELKPSHANAHNNLGVVFKARGQFEEAVTFYRKAIELNPREASPYHNLGEVYREAFRQLDKAEEFYRKAIQLAPDRADSAGTYSGLGIVAAQRGDLAEAEQWMRKAQALDPNSSSMNNNLGEILRSRGRLEDAVPYFRKAIELDPNNLGPLNNLAIIHATRREFAEAEKLFRGVIERASAAEKTPAYVNLASVLGEAGKLDEAEKLFREALVLSPNDSRVWNAFAFFLAEHRLKLDEALALSRRAVQAAPNDPNNFDTLGWVLFQRGELDEAEKILKKALELAGENPPASEIREHLKKVQEKKAPPQK